MFKDNGFTSVHKRLSDIVLEISFYGSSVWVSLIHKKKWRGAHKRYEDTDIEFM